MITRVSGLFATPALLAASAFAFTSLAPATGQACTAALLRSGSDLRVVKSFDWHDGAGFLLRNPAGHRKEALMLRPSGTPLRWIARHASLTLNQHGPGMPLSGMNDRGLVIETLWLRDTKWPGVDSRPAVNELQLVQYLLDTADTTKDALARARKVRVAAVTAKVHWLVCDRTGDCATVEHLGGKLVVHHGKTLPAAALTNHPYGSDPGWLASRMRKGSQRRFAAASQAARSIAGDKAGLPKRCDALLREVKAGTYTRWQLQWDPLALTARLRAGGKDRTARLVPPAPCSSTTGLRLGSPLVGDVTRHLAPLDPAAIVKQVARSVGKLGLPQPKGIARRVVQAHQRQTCALPGQ